MIWVVASNTNECRIFHYKKTENLLELLKEIKHPDSRKKNSELVADRPGRYSRGNFSPRTDPKENEIDIFARQISQELEAGRTENQFEKLVLISPPHMDGIIAKHLSKEVSNRIIGNLKKDYTAMKAQEMRDFLHENWLDIINT